MGAAKSKPSSGLVEQIVGALFMTALGAIIQRFSQPPPRENPTLEALGAQNRETAKVRRQRKERRQREVIRNTLDRTRPVVSPTDEEIDAVKTRLGYEKSHLHFAVSGPPGSGKSSLINALRGLKKNDREAAPVGSVETTTTITRYPDARQEIPFKWFVWYDVPGAGTLNVPSWQYFNQQGLFIFDFIILVYDTRFTEVDADILEDCRRFNIPALIVRSKADQHISNMMTEDDDLTYPEARDSYIKDTRQNLESNLRQRDLYDTYSRCYIVSSQYLYSLVKSVESAIEGAAPARNGNPGDIDEEELLTDILKTAHERRYEQPAQIAVNQEVAAATTATAETDTPAPRVGLGGSSRASEVQ